MKKKEKDIKVKQVTEASIEKRIYTIRGEQVMIDRDLAELYGVENRTLRQAVRRNIEKFPEDFLFRLSKEESNSVIVSRVSQSVIPSSYITGGVQMFAFTEQGVAMLSTILKSANAISVSIAIMRAFVMMRQFLTANASLFQRVNTLEQKQIETDKKLDFDKHNKQYETIGYVQLPHAVHDRYLIIDDEVWLLGSSVKDMGRSLCTIIKVGFSANKIIKMIHH